MPEQKSDQKPAYKAAEKSERRPKRESKVLIAGKDELYVRLHKFIADCGIASRRKAEDMIEDRLVTVNGKVVIEMGYKINPKKDSVKVRGKLVQMKNETVYLILNKPTRVLTTLKDPEGRPTVKDLLVGFKTRVVPVGRMDYESEGLLLLTNDGDFVQAFNHPSKKLTKTYLVKLDGQPTPEALLKLEAGITLAEGKVKALSVKKMKTGAQYDWIRVSLVEGRNQQLQRMFAKIGFDVLKIRRVAIGKLTLGGLERGEFKVISSDEVGKVFKDYDKN